MNTSLFKNKRSIFINALLITLFTPALQAEGLGRLFTTSEQRAMLERLRKPAPEKAPIQTSYKPITIVDHSKFEPPQEKYQHKVIDQFQFEPDPEPLIQQTYQPEQKDNVPEFEIPNITVNGFVKRSGGRSTAWVNDTNTYDGYFKPQHIKVNPHRIGRDHVHVEVDNVNIGDVSLKVGQTLIPKEKKITDSYKKMLEKPNK